jgi:hypothetical protein
VLRTSKRPEPVNLVHCPSCDRHEPFCYSCRHRPTPKNTLRGNPGVRSDPKHRQRPRLPQLEDTATSPHCRADPSLPRRQGKKLRREEMSPQVPVRVNPQVSFTNCHEDGGLRDRVGTEVVQLHPIDVQNRPHKTACRHSEPPLVKGDEAHDIPRRRGRGGFARGGASTPAAGHRREGEVNPQQQGPLGHPS